MRGFLEKLSVAKGKVGERWFDWIGGYTLRISIVSDFTRIHLLSYKSSHQFNLLKL